MSGHEIDLGTDSIFLLYDLSRPRSSTLLLVLLYTSQSCHSLSREREDKGGDVGAAFLARNTNEITTLARILDSVICRATLPCAMMTPSQSVGMNCLKRVRERAMQQELGRPKRI